VKDLENVLVVAKQLEHRRQVDPGRERVDGRGFLLVAELHQAQQRIIGVLAHEFGVDRDERRLGQALAQGLQRIGIGNQRVNLHREGHSGGLPA